MREAGWRGRAVREQGSAVGCTRRTIFKNCDLMMAKSKSHSERLHLKERPDAIMMQIRIKDHTFLQQFLKAFIVLHCAHRK